jgi:hypothetical protein
MPEQRLQRQVEPEEEEEETLQTKPLANQITPLVQVQRQEEELDEEEEEPIQTKQVSTHTPAVTPSLSSRIQSLKGGSRPLPRSARLFFEPRFGYDFSQVRVHTDARVTRTAQQLNAIAYTIGRNIFFSAGQYRPQTQGGKQLLAHELVHVIQQKRYLQRKPYRNIHQSVFARTTSHRTWRSLPKEAQKVLLRSFKTRQRSQWIWRDHKTAADCFNRWPSRHRNAFLRVYNALKGVNFVARGESRDRSECGEDGACTRD